MKLRLSALILIAAALLALVAACGGGGGGGGGDELTLEEYFQRMDVLGDDLEDEIDRLGEEFEEAIEGAETEEDVIEPFRDFFDRLRARFEDFVVDLDSIDPPSEVEDAHNEIVAVQAEGLELLEDLDERAQRAESASDFEELSAELDGPVFTDVSDRGEQACFALEAIADENGIDVDLECEEEEE